jgi:hypothetical protein
MRKIDRRGGAQKLRGRKLSKEEEKGVAEAEKYWENQYKYLIDPIERSQRITGKDLKVTILGPGL